MRRQAQDVATNLPSMTNREDLPETVAVPVELLKRVQGDGVTSPATNELLALTPTPKPRLVAVDPADWGPNFDEWFDAQPDLLTLLDEVLEDWRLSTFSGDTDALSARIRTALGVTE